MMKGLCSTLIFSAVLIGGGSPRVFGLEESPETTGEAQPKGLEFVHIPAGTFIMGSPEGAYPSFENPPHNVTVSAYEISKCEITNEQYATFCDETDRDYPPVPGWYEGTSDDEDYFEEFAVFPVVHVSWHDAVEYCEWLSQEIGSTVRLPTEAEWERAARFSEGEETTVFSWGNEFPTHHGIPDHTMANLVGKDDHFAHTAPVGSFKEGAAAIHGALVLDLIGNVSEWCHDRFDPEYYSQEPEGGWKDPQGPEREFRRVVKGSSFRHNAPLSRPARRVGFPPSTKSDAVGFRVVKVK